MTRLPLFCLALLFCTSLSTTAQSTAPAKAQSKSTAAAPLVIGQTFTMPSKVLGETRRLNVYLPQAYQDSATLRLPVLYMPDGGLKEDFLHVAGLLQVLVGNGTMRPFILVGIENTQRRRDMTGPTTNAEDKKIAPRVGGSAAFRQFIRTELIPEVTKRYRTTAEKAVVGESLAGLFVLETMILEPALFDTYVAIDPSLWWNNEQLVAQAGSLQLKEGGAPKTLYVATSIHGESPAAQRLDQTMRAKAGRALNWYYAPMPQETHATIYHPAALQAFRTVFKPQP